MMSNDLRRQRRQIKEQFQQSLLNISRLAPDASESEVAEAARAWREALLLYGSQGDDNLDCVHQLTVANVAATHWDCTFCGLRLAALEELALSEILWLAEGIPIPEQVRERLPALTQEQWDAALRMATLMATAFEGETALPPPKT